MNTDQIETELRHLATKEELANLRADLHKDFGDFKAEVQKAFGDFRVDIVKTLWLSQLSTAGLILVGIGVIVHFRV